VTAQHAVLPDEEPGALTDTSAIDQFTALYDEHHRSVYAYAVSRAGRQLADEVVGEVFLVVWRRLADVPRPALPWLLAVTRNVAIGQFRAAVRQQSIAAELQAWASTGNPADGGQDVADVVSERLSALRALTSLTEADRELLTLVAWHGLSPRDAAQVVGCSTATFFVRLHRARRRLERAMETEPAGKPRGREPVKASEGERS
jgi:RNA polymerase sigma-70 factor, ECF subfamily